MTDHHDAHGHGKTPTDWLVEHLGGPILSYGAGFEKVVETLMMPIVNGWFVRGARWYLIVASPILVLVFLLQVAGGSAH